MGLFVEVCRRRGLKDSAGKSKVMVLSGEDGLECEVCVDGIRLEHVSEIKHLGCFGRIRYRIDRMQHEGGEWEEGSKCYYVSG